MAMEEERQEPKRQRKYKKRNKLLKNLQDQVDEWFCPWVAMHYKPYSLICSWNFTLEIQI